MAPAADALDGAMADVTFAPLKVPVVTNVEATPNEDASRVRGLLKTQVTAPVKWQTSVEKLAEMGVDAAYEIGAGAVLAGLVKRITKGFAVTGFGKPDDLEKLA